MSRKNNRAGIKALSFGLSFAALGGIIGLHTFGGFLLLAFLSSVIAKAVTKIISSDSDHYGTRTRPMTTEQREAAEWGRSNSESMARTRARYEAQAQAKLDARAQEQARRQAEADAKYQAEMETRAKAEAEARIKAEAETAAKAKAEADAKAKAEAEARAKVDPNDNSPEGIVARGKDMLWQIREANAAIPDAELTNQLNKLESRCAKIFQTVQDRPEKAPMVRKFLSYYLPTTLNMLSNYRLMQDRGVAEDDMNEVHSTLVRGLDMVLSACKKLQTNLYRENMMDVATDMNVLEQMLVRDGLSDGNTSFPTLGGNAGATAEALHQSGAPIMDFSDVDAQFEESKKPQSRSSH